MEGLALVLGGKKKEGGWWVDDLSTLEPSHKRQLANEALKQLGKDRLSRAYS